MKTEFEVTFYDINKTELIEKLKNIGATCILERTLMKRVIFENPLNKEKSYVRVRDEGNKITCTYKEISDGKLDINSMKEIETNVGDFDSMVSIFRAVGLKQKSYQETYRETWGLGEKVFFMIDEWPGLKTFIEIEGESEEIVREYSKKLGFDFENDGLFGAVDEIYLSKAGIPKEVLNNLEFITFDNPPKKYI